MDFNYSEEQNLIANAAKEQMAEEKRLKEEEAEIAAMRKKVDEETQAALNAGGEYSNMTDAEKEQIRQDAEAWKAHEEELIRARNAARLEQEQWEKKQKAAEDLAKEEADEAEKLRKQEEEWKKQDIEDAKKLIKIARDAQADFEKQQDEANKFKDMAPQTSPSFQANSIAEFTFRKEKELQRDKQREENKREAARREHAEQLNENLIAAMGDLGINETDPDLGFEAIE